MYEPPTERSDALGVVMERSRALGFLGPGPVADHVANARAFIDAIGARRRILDLGSGGGVPGLVLAVELPDVRVALLDAMEKRCRFLRSAVVELGLEARVDVLCGRAEELARDPRHRGRFDAVVARSFAVPAATAECGVGFLHGPGARLLVSEPPSTGARWPVDGVAQLGLSVGTVHRAVVGSSIQVLEVVQPCPERFPRRIGLPEKRPLF